jgi:hypothetical protein
MQKEHGKFNATAPFRKIAALLGAKKIRTQQTDDHCKNLR